MFCLWLTAAWGGMGAVALGAVLGAAAAALAATLYLRRWRARIRSYELRARQTEQLAELGRLTGGLAHEIRNPLSTMKVNLQLLAEDLRDAERDVRFQDVKRHSLNRVATLQAEADRLAEILENFLRYAGKIEVRPCRCDANQVVEHLLDFFEPQARGSRLTLRRSLCPDPLPCRLDQTLFKQALLNLLVNAQQAMDAGGELIVRTAPEGDRLRIEVADTGPGIPPDHIPRVFEVFYSTKKGGTGLGLPTSKRIIEEHGGTIEMHSQTGRGTCFVIRLPLEPSE